MQSHHQEKWHHIPAPIEELGIPNPRNPRIFPASTNQLRTRAVNPLSHLDAGTLNWLLLVQD